MINLQMSKLMKKVDNRYTLCMLVSKRARQLIDESDRLSGSKTGKPVSIATDEVYEGRLTYVRTKSGIK